MKKLNNEACREQAIACLSRGDFRNAVRWYNSACARTLGHGKADRYESLAKQCAKLGDIDYPSAGYAEDAEAS